MKRWGYWRTLWQRLTQRQQFEHDLRAELEFHVQCRVDALCQTGLSQAQAQRQAKLELGMVESHKEAVRAAVGLSGFDQCTLALNRAGKSLRRYRGLAVCTALILSLAMALNLSAYGIYRSYLSNVPDVMRGQPTFDVVLRNQKSAQLPRLDDVEYAAVQDQIQALAKIVISSKQVRMRVDRSAAAANTDLSAAYGLSVSGRYFADLNRGSPWQPRLGRWLNAADDAPQASNVIVLSDSGWRRLTGADPAIIGKSLRFAMTSFTVVGVMPEDYIDLQPFPSHFWISHSGYRQWQKSYAGTDINNGMDLTLIGVFDADRVSQELVRLLANIPSRSASTDERIAGVQLLPRLGLFPASDAQDVEIAAIPVLLLCLIVLLVACANLANLTLAKALGQRQEFAVHASLGASRWRIVMQLTLESGLLTLACMLLALGLSLSLADSVQHYLFSGLQEMGIAPFATRFDAAVVGFALFLALVSTLMIGTIPAWLATQNERNLSAQAKPGYVGHAMSPSRWRNSLSIVQIAASFGLLFLTALASQVAFNSRNVELGYAREPLVDVRHPKPSAALRQQIEQLPGVTSTTAVAATPLYGWQPLTTYRIGEQLASAGVNRVDERFIGTLGIQLLQGRNFTRAEAESDAPVALLSAAAARAFWPNERALGKVIRDADDAQGVRGYTVIGIVEDVISGLTFQGKDRAVVYQASALGREGISDLIVAVVPEQRVHVMRELASLCARLNAADACDPWSFERLVERQQVPFAIAQNVALTLAITALVICVFGLFGMVKFNVSNRRREMSLRLAIGASPDSMVPLMLREVRKHLLWGCALSMPLCVVFWLLIQDSFRIGLLSAIAQMSVACGILFAAAVLAARIPAKQATQISPMESLRQL